MQAEGDFRTSADNVGQFYVRNTSNDMVPLSALVSMEPHAGPGIHDALQCSTAPPSCLSPRSPATVPGRR